MKRLILTAFLGFVPVLTVSALAPVPVYAAQALGDLSSLQAIVTDVQGIAKTGDFGAAAKRITDFETAWDKDEPTLKPMDKKAWHHVDNAADAALKALRVKTPDSVEVSDTLAALSAALANP